MTDAFRGLYRNVAGAYVTNVTMAFHVPEADYRAFGYEPDFDNLPWQESYNAAKVAHADSDREDARDAPHHS
jgi:hypothetical protein